MLLVPAREQDYTEIMDVWEASVRATHDFLTEQDIQFFKRLILDKYLAAVDLYCIRDASNRIQGFLGVANQNIEMLFLAPQDRGKGLGKTLVEFAIKELGANNVDVNEQNPSAIGFYKHMGFKVVRRSPVDGTGRPFPILHMELR